MEPGLRNYIKAATARQRYAIRGIRFEITKYFCFITCMVVCYKNQCVEFWKPCFNLNAGAVNSILFSVYQNSNGTNG